MPRAGFEPTTPVFERSKTVRALDGEVTGTGKYVNQRNIRKTYDILVYNVV
jgi:hypothetical protein